MLLLFTYPSQLFKTLHFFVELFFTTVWPVKHGFIFQKPCKPWLIPCTFYSSVHWISNFLPETTAMFNWSPCIFYYTWMCCCCLHECSLHPHLFKQSTTSNYNKLGKAFFLKITREIRKCYKSNFKIFLWFGEKNLSYFS